MASKQQRTLYVLAAKAVEHLLNDRRGLHLDGLDRNTLADVRRDMRLAIQAAFEGLPCSSTAEVYESIAKLTSWEQP